MTGNNFAGSLASKRYLATILKDVDPENRGRYRVHIPELMHKLSSKDGIWVTNHIHNWRYDNNLSYGQYFPIVPGSRVFVAFDHEDYQNGKIVQAVTDSDNDKMPFNAYNDRDELYLVLSTAGQQHIIAACNDTNDMPGGSLHIYAAGRKCKIVMNGNGIFIYSAGEIGISAGAVNIKADVNIEGNVNIKGTTVAGHIDATVTKSEYADSAGRAPTGSASPKSPGSPSGNGGYGAPGEVGDVKKKKNS